MSTASDYRKRALHEVIDAALRRSRHGPVGAGVRAGAVVIAAVATAELHRRTEPGVLCPLRRFTGVPCPLCGSTTVFIEAGSGDLRAAWLANPLTALGTAGLVVAPLGFGRSWWRASPRVRNVALGVALVISWIWQLWRFDTF